MRLGPLVLLGSLALAACDTHEKPPQTVSSSARSVDVVRREGNHLVGEPSPYLEEHAHNPVDWYPWAPEALARAKRENKPIFLSIGYSTCHWCHVMAKESFEDDEVAKKLNDGFIAVKVDREQRPDLDAFYQRAASDLGASGGWPLTLVLTPDLVPIFAASYLPKRTTRGRIGLVDALDQVANEWKQGGGELVARGRALMKRLEAAAAREAATAEVSDALEREAITKIARARDDVNGGFGARQKFFESPSLLAELRYAEREGDAAARQHVTLTLEKAMRGGVHDWISGTFHRYATDHLWHLPHFEKTLYDNAQLASLYLEASIAFGRRDFELVGRAILDDLIAHWQRTDGGMIVGFDADDPRGEGAFYTFTPGELRAILGDADARVVGAAFGVTDHGEASLGKRSVLDRSAPDAEVAKALGVGVEELQKTIAKSLPMLAEARARRPPPRADDKELSAWNGLALIALADAARWLDDPRYLDAAERVAGFLARNWDSKGGKLARGVRGVASLGPGYLDDIALAALGLVHLHAADGDARWLLEARAMADAIVSPRDVVKREALPFGHESDEDGVLPSGASAAAMLLATLAALGSDPAMEKAADHALAIAAARLRDEPSSSAYALAAVDLSLSDAHEIVLAGDAKDDRTKVLAKIIAPLAGARAILARLPSGGPAPEVAKLYPSLEGKSALGGKPTVFVCTHGTCEAPASDPIELEKRLEGLIGAESHHQQKSALP